MDLPMTEMTDEQRQTYKTYITARRDSGIALREPLWLALILAREKPALLMEPDLTPPRSPPWDSWDPMGKCDFVEQPVPPEQEITLLSFEDETPDPPLTIEELLTAFELPYREFKSAVCVARTSWRLDLLPTRTSRAGYHRRLGVVFGYPRVDVEYFVTTGLASSRTTPEDLIAEDRFQPEELTYTTFLPQVHEDSVEGYERAIESGKQIRSTITSLAEQWDLTPLDALAETIYERALSEYR